MPTPKIRFQKITGPYFQAHRLKIRQFDSVQYTLARPSGRSDRHGGVPDVNHLVLVIPDLDIQSPEMALRDSFQVQFTTVGTYLIKAKGFPSMVQQVVVEEEPTLTDFETDSLEVLSGDKLEPPTHALMGLSTGQAKWAKRPRSRPATITAKKLGVKKQATDSGGSKSSLCHSGKDSDPGVARRSHCSEVSCKNEDLPKTVDKPQTDDGPDQKGQGLDSTLVVTDTQPPKPDGVIERITFTGMNSAAVVQTLQRLKGSYERPPSEIGRGANQPTSLEALAQLIPGWLAELTEPVCVPKGHTARRLKRTMKRMEDRF